MRGLAAGRALVEPDLREALGLWAQDDGHVAQIVEFGIHSFITAPLQARGTVIGVAGFLRSQMSEPFEEDDLALAEELAARAAVCIDNARRYTREHRMAVTLQRSPLPRALPEQDALEAAYRYLPTQAGVGGDWFDVIPLSGARVALVVGDLVGHGIQASATMGRLRAAMRTLADVDLPPDELLTHLDDVVLRCFEVAESSILRAPGRRGRPNRQSWVALSRRPPRQNPHKLLAGHPGTLGPLLCGGDLLPSLTQDLQPRLQSLLHPMPGLRQHGHVFFGDIALGCYGHKARWTYDERDIRRADHACAPLCLAPDDVVDVQLPVFRDVGERDPENWSRPDWRASWCRGCGRMLWSARPRARSWSADREGLLGPDGLSGGGLPGSPALAELRNHVQAPPAFVVGAGG